MKLIPACSVIFCLIAALHAAEFHITTTGDDSAPGNKDAPLRTIQRGAELAQPGDVITVHAGTYRERINPPRGGESDSRRITYQAAPGEKVEVKGSEIIKNWVKFQNDVWQVTIPNSLFGDFNPYNDLIRGDWFGDNGRSHHTGAVYLNGIWLSEAAKLENVMDANNENPLWFARVEKDNTTIFARFKGVDPNEQQVEINVRHTIFYPDQPGRNFITLRGFIMRHAATPWAPPTAEQVGLIGTHWSKGWIIENNTISHSICSGISLGKYGDAYDNTSADSAEGYVETIKRAQSHPIPWTKENIGHHIVRNNTISHCEQAGIVGSLGCAFSSITDNLIHDIHVRRLFDGCEMGGIKFHGAIDTEILRNHIHHVGGIAGVHPVGGIGGIWLDWMTQGTRISKNLLHDNYQDFFIEVNHGPFVVDHNLSLSNITFRDCSQGGAYLHNLIAGKIIVTPEGNRDTPYHPPHSTTISGLANIKCGDNRFYNNIIVGSGEPESAAQAPTNKDPGENGGYGLWVYEYSGFPLLTGGNVYFNGAKPHTQEASKIPQQSENLIAKIIQQAGQYHLVFTAGPTLGQTDTKPITTPVLGKTQIAGLPYVNSDDSPLIFDTDYFGKPRSKKNPTPGPFENPTDGKLKLEIRQP